MGIHLLEKTPAVRYLPIYLESLRLDTVLDFDLYIKIGKEMILYRSMDLPFTDKTLAKLVENKVARLYVNHKAKDKYQKYIEQNLQCQLHLH